MGYNTDMNQELERHIGEDTEGIPEKGAGKLTRWTCTEGGREDSTGRGNSLCQGGPLGQLQGGVQEEWREKSATDHSGL